MNYSANSLEVDESSPSFCVNQLDANPVTHVYSFEITHHFPFNLEGEGGNLAAQSISHLSNLAVCSPLFG